MPDNNLHELNEYQIACERLNQTRMPFAYTLLLHKIAYIFRFTIPSTFYTIQFYRYFGVVKIHS